MSELHSLSSLLHDPPPPLAFEISEAGVAVARFGANPTSDFRPLPGVVSVSPLRDNILQPGELAATIKDLAGTLPGRKRRDAALILPDYSTRMAVLDFDEFPANADEQAPLVRFRMKKSLPFDVESAALSYFAQSTSGKKKTDVVAVVTPLEIVARYEAPLRSAGLNPGLVTTSALASLQLVNEKAPAVVAKLSGRTLTVMVLDNGVLKLIRCLELAQPDLEEIASDLFPTFVYVEDNLETQVRKLLLCGFGAMADAASHQFHAELSIPVETLRSPFGLPGEHNAGLLGYMAANLVTA